MESDSRPIMGYVFSEGKCARERTLLAGCMAKRRVVQLPRRLTTVGVIPQLSRVEKKRRYLKKNPKIKWPKANDTATYDQFDEEVSKLVRRFKGTTDERLEKLAEIVYEEGLRRFGLEKEESPRQGQKKGGPSRRKSEADELRKAKKRLRTLWLNAEEHEKEGLKVLFER